MAVAGERLGIGIRRYFTEEGQHPFDQVAWERRDSRISDYRTGAVAFEQLGVEVPATWSMNATNILAQKYFRGTLGTPEREWSLRQVINRVVDTVTTWGVKDGYFVDAAEASAFSDELKHLIVEQKAAFNSPVWFNIGVKGVPQQASACQPYDALVSTPEGLVPIGRLVEQEAIGHKVYDAEGVTRIVAVKANGRKHVLRITTKSGHQLDVTADHLVWRATGSGTGSFVPAGTLEPGDQLSWHRHESWGEGEISSLEDFVARWGLEERGAAMTVPQQLFSAPLPVVAAYLQSLFEAEGYVSVRERSAVIGLDMVSEGIVRGAQALLARFGIFSRVRFKADRGPDGQGCFSLTIRSLGDRRLFADEIGFVDPGKAISLAESLELEGLPASDSKRLEIETIEDRGVMEVFDIQTESGEYLSGSLRVHNCFILAVEDSMNSILNWYVEEGTIFKGGSGSGVNLSRIRSSKELLQGGGTASGPVSFMRGADASAGTIKSGGKTRRAAKMVILDADHPDIREFVWCKAKEERKARVLAQAGFDMDLDGADSHSTQYQNANNSVRVTDEFMQAVVDDSDWALTSRMTGEAIETVKARELFREIAEAAWECADPGMQYDTTINKWHTAPNTGRITASNPCFTGDMRVHTDKGFVAFADLVARVNAGEEFAVYTHDATNVDAPEEVALLSRPEAFMITGFNDIVKLRFDNGMELRCTPGHRIFTTNRGYVEASGLTPEDRVKILDVPAPAVNADPALPVATDPSAYREAFGHSELLRFPEEWSEGFAHYLGWLIGDGSTSGSTTSTIYGSAEDRDEILPLHQELLEWVNGDRRIKVSEQANGTAQLRLGRAAFKRFLEALGVASVKGGQKVVPWSIEQAPEFAVAAFLSGLFDADGCVRIDHQKGSYVGLGSISKELLRGVQRLLTTFGISSRIYDTNRAGKSAFSHTRKDGSTVEYTRSASYDLRISGRSIGQFAAKIGFTLSRKALLLDELLGDRERGFYNTDRTVSLVECVEDGVELTYNLSEPRNHSYVVNGVVVRNCSEYVHLDNSSCNLASLNLLRFCDEGGTFDVEGFRAAVEVVFTAQEILVGNADYPTEKIGDTTRRFRELGLGYANLGAFLMSEGLPYDSEEGRAWTSAITALMTGVAYETSARTAARMGPFAGFHENAKPMIDVLKMHRAAVAGIDEELVPTELLSAAQEAWDAAVELAEVNGVRNSQSTVLAPTGTISFLMDCDTTGIEPDLGLVKTKKLVGGGTMSIVNQTVPRALRRLGYSTDEITKIVEHIDEHKTIVGAPALKAEHLPVFACSMGDNVIHYLGHVKMMAAAQPFISGAISKTVNMPEEVTVEEVEQLHIDAWKMGLKAIAIYRDNCKVGQPLSMTKKEGASASPTGAVEAEVRDELQSTAMAAREAELTARIADLEGALQASRITAPAATTRTRLPRRRRSNTFAFRVADCEGYVTVGEYEDGRPGEVFMKVSKQGSTLSGVMDAFSISVSLGLQHGVPLSTFVRKYTNMRFEPAGITDDPDLRLASSLVDYIFRRLAIDYLSYDERLELGVLSTGERSQPTLPGLEDVDGGKAIAAEKERFGAGGDATTTPAAPSSPVAPPAASAPQMESRDAPFCYACGNVMQRAGSCYACPSCGATSGCS
jgi:ribonucleoside-diphosphate reductase alpha chain